MNPAPMLFVEWEPDPVLMGVRFNTGFSGFRTASSLRGCAKVEPGSGCLQILALIAEKPGRGDWSHFLKQAKELFDEIVVWELWNDDFARALERSGFEVWAGLCSGEPAVGMRWARAEAKTL